MKKYRIIKSEKINGDGSTVKTSYFIQKRFLFWWHNASILCGYTLQNSDFMLQNYIVEFLSIEQAKESLDKYLLKPYRENYKRNAIISVPYGDDWKELFVNLDRQIKRYSFTGYEASFSLDDLKKGIDKRITKTINSVII